MRLWAEMSLSVEIRFSEKGFQISVWFSEKGLQISVFRKELKKTVLERNTRKRKIFRESFQFSVFVSQSTDFDFRKQFPEIQVLEHVFKDKFIKRRF